MTIPLGLRYRPDAIRELMKGVSGLEESTIYQEILGKGEEIGRVKGREAGSPPNTASEQIPRPAAV
jgi:predicted transposase YdaD